MATDLGTQDVYLRLAHRCRINTWEPLSAPTTARIASPRQCARCFSRAKVDVAKAYAAQLKSESGDMKSIVSAIQDSVLAAGMGIKMHDDDGEPLRGSRVC